MKIEIKPAYAPSDELVNGERLLVIGNGGLFERVHVPVEIANEVGRLQKALQIAVTALRVVSDDCADEMGLTVSGAFVDMIEHEVRGALDAIEALEAQS